MYSLIVFTFLLSIFYRDLTYLGLSAPVPGGFLYITEIMLFFLVFSNIINLISFNWIGGNLRKTYSNLVLGPYIIFALLSLFALINGFWEKPGLLIREFASFYYSIFFFIPIISTMNYKSLAYRKEKIDK